MGVELIDGVEFHLLNSGIGVYLAVAEDSAHFLLRFFRTLVAVVVGLTDNAFFAVKENIVHSPGVDGDTVEISAGNFKSFGKSGDQFFAEGVVIPIKSIAFFDRTVFETVNFAEREFSGIDFSDNGASA